MVVFVWQIISPIDKEIQQCIVESLVPQVSWDVEISADTLDQTELNSAVDAYYAQLAAGVFNPELNAESQIKAAYTAMHGVGYPAVVRAFQVANFKVNLTHG